ncbi:hypothetical protein [Stenotrophomonas sp.]|uniref:hypothetical protein n=1 Tax=Stenotrophomonas sp. TaxID=69392 RepID=UPI0028B0F852|nr:hypothetical protein [Stenotrophomonas sp.]
MNQGRGTKPKSGDSRASAKPSTPIAEEGGSAEASTITDSAKDEGAVKPPAPANGDPGKIDPDLTPDGMKRELEKNVAANRSKRWWAFAFVGLVVAAFFALLLAAFCKLFFGTYLVDAIKAANESWQWHVLVFLGVSLVLLAAIPLSLSLAMVKMIGGGGQEESGAAVKTPSVELVKALADIFKAVAASIKP